MIMELDNIVNDKRNRKNNYDDNFTVHVKARKHEISIHPNLKDDLITLTDQVCRAVNSDLF